MLLRRLSYPCRYGDMIQRFAKPVPVFSMVTNTLIDYIYEIHGQRITHWNPAILDPDHQLRCTRQPSHQEAHLCTTALVSLMVP